MLNRALALTTTAFLLLVTDAIAPETPLTQVPSEPGCGSDLTPEEAQRYLDILAQQPVDPVPPYGTPPPYCVPIAGHIVRQSDGTGGLSLTRYFQSITDANTFFAPMGIQFYSLGVDYIDSDFFYSQIQSIGDIDALRSTNVVNAAINVYYTPTLPGLCGISSFTFSAVQGIVMANGCSGVPSNPSTMPHEIGHYFNLFHTHETATGTELVNGTNCGSAGDLLCDTPADPVLGSGNVTAGCQYVGAATDPNGQPYSPDTHQIMSYSRPLCADNFSAQSQTRAVNTLLNNRPELLARGCTPVAPAVITGVTPGTGFIDETRDVYIVGSNLGVYTAVNFGGGVTVNFSDSLATDTLRVNITISAATAPGVRSVIVNNAFQPDTLEAAFEVLGTPVHYVSPAGAHRYPYASAADAATTLSAVLIAAINGDSVRVDSTTIVATTINVSKSVHLSGGWTNGFTARDIASKKTRIELAGNILLGGSGASSMDGFLIHDGEGTVDISPITGNYGGGLRVIGGVATIRNCEFRLGDANPGSGFGGGGAIFGHSATITIENCYIHDNVATRGGAIYLYNCTGAITNSVIANNAVAPGGSNGPEGGAVALHNCTNVSITGTCLDDNTGAQNGGGLWVLNSTGVVVDGGEVLQNTASFGGGGVFTTGSTVALDGVHIGSNTASIFGGGVMADAASNLTVTSCSFTDNSAVLAGGLIVQSSTGTIQSSIFVTNSGAGGNGGVYFSSAGGSVTGNTLYANSGGAGTGGIGVAASAVSIQNNIVANSTGHGIACSGGTPTLAYNLVFGSTGNAYDGCAAGTGALTGDPLFINAALSDFHLGTHSPGIDAANPSGTFNDGDSGRGDMGAFSGARWGDQPARPLGLSATSGTGVTLAWDRATDGDVSHYLVYCDTTSGFTPSMATFVTATADTFHSAGLPTDSTYYVVSAVDTVGYAGGYSEEICVAPLISTPVVREVTHRTTLSQNVPNPFNPTTTIRFTVADGGYVKLSVYDVAGREVRTLEDGPRTSGAFTTTWDGFNNNGQRVSSGVYFYRLEAPGFAQTRKMVLLK